MSYQQSTFNQGPTYKNNRENVFGISNSSDIMDFLSMDPPKGCPFADMFTHSDAIFQQEKQIKNYPNQVSEEYYLQSQSEWNSFTFGQDAKSLLIEDDEQLKKQNLSFFDAQEDYLFQDNNNQDIQSRVQSFSSQLQIESIENCEFSQTQQSIIGQSIEEYEDIQAELNISSYLLENADHQNEKQDQQNLSISQSQDYQYLSGQKSNNKESINVQSQVPQDFFENGQQTQSEQEEECKIMEIQYDCETEDFNQNYENNIQDDVSCTSKQNNKKQNENIIQGDDFNGISYPNSLQGNLNDRDLNYKCQIKKEITQKQKVQKIPKSKRTYSLIGQELYQEYQLQSYEMIMELLKKGVYLKNNFEYYGLQEKETISLSTLQGQITKLIKGTNNYNSRLKNKEAISVLKKQVSIYSQEFDFSQGKKVLTGFQANISRKTCQRQILKQGLKFITSNNKDQYHTYPENKKYILKVINCQENPQLPYLKLIQKN